MKPSKLKKVLIILVLSMIALRPNIAISNDDCKEVVKAADRALADQDRVIDLKTRQITVQSDIIAAQDTRITELEKRDGNIFKSPFLYLTLGLVVGGLVMKGANK